MATTPTPTPVADLADDDDPLAGMTPDEVAALEADLQASEAEEARGELVDGDEVIRTLRAKLGATPPTRHRAR